jgi:hypothetical protein
VLLLDLLDRGWRNIVDFVSCNWLRVLLQTKLLRQGIVGVVVRLEHGGLRRRSAVRRIHSPRELCDGVVLVV